MNERERYSYYDDLLDQYLVNDDPPSSITRQQFNNYSPIEDDILMSYPEIKETVNAMIFNRRVMPSFKEQFDLLSTYLSDFNITKEYTKSEEEIVNSEAEVIELPDEIHDNLIFGTRQQASVEEPPPKEEIQALEAIKKEELLPNEQKSEDTFVIPGETKEDTYLKADQHNKSQNKLETTVDVEEKSDSSQIFDELTPRSRLARRLKKVEQIKSSSVIPLDLLITSPNKKKGNLTQHPSDAEKKLNIFPKVNPIDKLNLVKLSKPSSESSPKIKQAAPKMNEHKKDKHNRILFNLEYDSTDQIESDPIRRKSKHMSKSKSASSQLNDSHFSLIASDSEIDEEFYEEEDCSGDEDKYGGILAFAKNLGFSLDYIPEEQTDKEALDIINGVHDVCEEEVASQYNSKPSVISDTNKLNHKIRKSLDENHHIKNAIVLITTNNGMEEIFSKYSFKVDIKLDFTYFPGYNLSPFRTPPTNRKLYYKWVRKMLKRDKEGEGEDDVDHEFLPQKDGRDVTLSQKEMESFTSAARMIWHYGRTKLFKKRIEGNAQ